MIFSKTDRRILSILLKDNQSLTVVELQHKLKLSRQSIYNSLRFIVSLDIVLKIDNKYKLNEVISCDDCRELGTYLLEKMMDISKHEFKSHYSDNPPYYLLLALIQLTYDSVSELQPSSL